jgi:RNA polymerase sigma-70 factor (ECF subfamily)
MEDDVQELLQRKRYDEALERLLNVYGKKVFRMAVMMLKDVGRAEEVTQDVFLKLWQALPSYDGRASPGTWLYAIARNTCLSAIRSASYRMTVAMSESHEPAVPSRPTLDIALEECLSKLPPIQRDVITLYYLQERSVRDVAQMLELPEGTVKSHLHRARHALGLMLE